MKFIEDKELNLNEKENDLLNGKSYVETLKSLIKNAPHSGTFTIGLFGEWGSGKSSIIKTVKEEISKNHNEYGNIKFVIYDAWKYVKDSFRRMFLLNLQKELKQEKTDLMERFYCNKTVEQTIKLKFSSEKFSLVCHILFITSLIALISLPFISVNPSETHNFPKIWSIAAFSTFIISLIGLLVRLVFKCFSELKTSMNVPLMFAPEQFEDCFKDIISKALKQNRIHAILNWVKRNNASNDKIVIVIDNIDRCSNDTAYELLTDIKNFMGNYDNLIFIIPIDDIALKKHLIKNNNSNRDAEEFLRKFFNVELRIKHLENVELYDFAYNLNKKYNLDFRPDTLSIIANDYATNPRRIIQLCNNLTSEINVLSKSCDKVFLYNNESIICKALIIREEWPDYYKLMLSDNSLLKAQSCETTVNDLRLNRFLRSTFFLTQNVDISVIEQILSNKASFQKLPSNILTAISSFDIQQLLEYVNIATENKDLCIKYLLDRLKKSIDREHYATEVIKTFTALISLNENSKLSDIDNTQIQTVIAEKIKNFISFLPPEYFPTLAKYLNDLGYKDYFAKEIGLYLGTEIKNEEKNSDDILEFYKVLLIDCHDIKYIKESFLHWYKSSNTALSALPLENKISSLITDELLEYEFENIKDLNDKNWVLDDLEFIVKYGNITNTQTNMIVDTIKANSITYNGNNKSSSLNMLKNITNIITNLHIEEIKNFQAFYNDVFKNITVGYQQKSLLSILTDEDENKTAINFIEASHIASCGKLNTSPQLKILFDKDVSIRPYIISSIKNISDKNFLIGTFKDCIFSTIDISEDYLYILGKVIREVKGEEFVINDAMLKNKLEFLINDTLTTEHSTLVNGFFENNINNNNRMHDYFIQLVSAASKKIILALSPKLQKYAFDNVCKNLSNYIQEKPLLEALSKSQNREHIAALSQIIQTNLISHNDSEFWKNLYEGIDKKYMKKRDKEIIQSILKDELDETETVE